MAQADRNDLPTDVGFGAFVPVAFYDKHMDCIRVLTHDRSVTEVRVDGTFTLHRCNHRSAMDPKYVGFTLKGVRHIFDEVGLPHDGVLTLANIMDAIVKHSPGSSVAAVADLIFAENKIMGDISIDMADAQAA